MNPDLMMLAMALAMPQHAGQGNAVESVLASSDRMPAPGRLLFSLKREEEAARRLDQERVRVGQELQGLLEECDLSPETLERYPDLLAAFRRAYPDKARTVSSAGGDGVPGHDGHGHGTNGHSTRPTSDGTLASAEAALKHSTHALEHARQHVKQFESALERARAEVRRAEGRVTADQTYLEALRRAEQGGGTTQTGAASPKA